MGMEMMFPEHRAYLKSFPALAKQRLINSIWSASLQDWHPRRRDSKHSAYEPDRGGLETTGEAGYNVLYEMLNAHMPTRDALGISTPHNVRFVLYMSI